MWSYRCVVCEGQLCMWSYRCVVCEAQLSVCGLTDVFFVRDSSVCGLTDVLFVRDSSVYGLTEVNFFSYTAICELLDLVCFIIFILKSPNSTSLVRSVYTHHKTCTYWSQVCATIRGGGRSDYVCDSYIIVTAFAVKSVYYIIGFLSYIFG